MSAILYPALALLVLATAGAAICLPRPSHAVAALSANCLTLAVIAQSLALENVAMAWCLLALAALVYALLARPEPFRATSDTGGRGAVAAMATLAIITAIFFLIVLGTVLVATDSPIWRWPPATSGGTTDDLMMVALLLGTRYGPGLVGLGLLLLTLFLADRLREEES